MLFVCANVARHGGDNWRLACRARVGSRAGTGTTVLEAGVHVCVSSFIVWTLVCFLFAAFLVPGAAVSPAAGRVCPRQHPVFAGVKGQAV